MSECAYPYYQPDMERTAEDVLKDTAYQFAVCLGEEQPRPLILHRSSSSAHHMLYKTERAARQGRSRVVGKTNWFAEEIVVIEKRQAIEEGTEARYPEHAKLAKVKEESQTIGEFLDYGLPRQGLVLYEEVEMRDGWREVGERWHPTHKTIQAILAEYFGIDQKKIEEEKRAMLEELRAA